LADLAGSSRALRGAAEGDPQGWSLNPLVCCRRSAGGDPSKREDWGGGPGRRGGGWGPGGEGPGGGADVWGGGGPEAPGGLGPHRLGRADFVGGPAKSSFMVFGPSIYQATLFPIPSPPPPPSPPLLGTQHFQGWNFKHSKEWIHRKGGVSNNAGSAPPLTVLTIGDVLSIVSVDAISPIIMLLLLCYYYYFTITIIMLLVVTWVQDPKTLSARCAELHFSRKGEALHDLTGKGETMQWIICCESAAAMVFCVETCPRHRQAHAARQ